MPQKKRPRAVSELFAHRCQLLGQMLALARRRLIACCMVQYSEVLSDDSDEANAFLRPQS